MEKLQEALSSKFESMSIEMHNKDKYLYSTNIVKNDNNDIIINF